MDNPMGGSPLTGPGNVASAPVVIARAGRMQLGDPATVRGAMPEAQYSGPVSGVPGTQNAQGVGATNPGNVMDAMGLNQPRPMMGGQVINVTGR